jgi:hypothetical protein
MTQSPIAARPCFDQTEFNRLLSAIGLATFIESLGRPQAASGFWDASLAVG